MPNFSFLLINIWPKSVLKISSTESFGDELFFKDTSLTLLRNMEAEFHTYLSYPVVTVLHQAREQLKSWNCFQRLQQSSIRICALDKTT